MSGNKVKSNIELDLGKAEDQLRELEEKILNNTIKIDIDIKELFELKEELLTINEIFRKAFNIDNWDLRMVKEIEDSLIKINNINNEINRNFFLNNNSANNMENELNILISSYKVLIDKEQTFRNQMEKTNSAKSYEKLSSGISKINNDIASLTSKIKSININIKLKNNLADELTKLNNDIREIEKINNQKSNLKNQTQKNEANDSNIDKVLSSKAKESKIDVEFKMDTSIVQKNLEKITDEFFNIEDPIEGFNKLKEEMEKLANLPRAFFPSTEEFARGTEDAARSSFNLSEGLSNAGHWMRSSAIGSAIANTGVNLLNNAFMGLANVGINLATNALINYLNRKEIAAATTQENIQNISEEIDSYSQKREALKSIQKEYDQLNNKSNRTQKENERLAELNEELIKIDKNLFAGYDENGNPIVKLKGDVEDLILEYDKLIGKQKDLLGSEKGDQGKQANDKLHEKSLGNWDPDPDQRMKNSASIAQEPKIILDNYQNEMDKLQDKLNRAGEKVKNSTGEKRKKALAEYKKCQDDIAKFNYDSELKYRDAIDKVNELSYGVGEGLIGEVGNRKRVRMIENEDIKKSFSGLKDVLNFSELNTDDEYNSAAQALEKLVLAAGKGDINLGKLSESLAEANGELARTGDAEKYNETIGSLAKEYASLANIDPNILTKLFGKQNDDFIFGETNLDKKLKKFGKNALDLYSGDELAASIESQYQGISQLISDIEIEKDVKISLRSIKENESVPKQIKELIDPLLASGMSEEEALEFIVGLLIDLQDDNINVEDVQKKIDEAIGDNTYKITADIELSEESIAKIKADLLAYAEGIFGEGKTPKPAQTVINNSPATSADSVKNMLDIYNQFPNSIATIIEVEGAEEGSKKVLELSDKYKEFGTDLKKIISEDSSISLEKAVQMGEVYNKFPTEIKTFLTADGNEEILKNAEDVFNVLEKIPPEKRTEIEAKMKKDDLEGMIFTLDKIPIDKKVKLDLLNAEAKRSMGSFMSLLDQIPEENRAEVIASIQDEGLSNFIQSLDGMDIDKQIKIDMADAVGNKNVDDILGFMKDIPEEKRVELSMLINGAIPDMNLLDRLKFNQTATPAFRNDFINPQSTHPEPMVNQKVVIESEDNASETIDSVNSKEIGEKVSKLNAEDNATEAITLLNETNLESKDMDVNANDNVSGFIEWLSNILMPDKDTKITGTDEVSQIISGIIGLIIPDKNANIKGTDEVSPLINFIKGIIIPDKKTNVTAAGNPAINLINGIIGLIQKIPLNKRSQITASGNAEQVANNAKDAIDSVQGKTVTVTTIFKKITEYVTSFFGGGNSNSNNGGKKDDGKKNAQPVQRANDSDVKKQDSPKLQNKSLIMPMGAELPSELLKSDDPNDVEFVKTYKSIIANDGDSLALYFKYDINFLKELEAQIKKVSNAISLLDKKMASASNYDKMKYLEEQNKLYKEQQALIKEQIDKQGHLDRQRSWMQKTLKDKGFNINDLGEISNYEELLAKKAKELSTLEDNANKKNASEATKKKYENAKKAYDEMKKLADQYFDLEYTNIPKLKEEWEDLNKKIKEVEKEFKKLREEAWKTSWDAKWTSAHKHVEEVKNELAMVDTLMKNAFGDEKDSLIKRKIELLERQKKEIEDTNVLLAESMKHQKEKLIEFGFVFNDRGDIINFEQQMTRLQQTSTDFDYAKKYAEEYLDLFVKKIPEVEKSMAELENQIKEVEKEFKKFQEEAWQTSWDAKWTSANKRVEEVKNELAMVDILMKNAFGSEKDALIKRKIELLEKQKKEIEDTNVLLAESMKHQKEKLIELGFRFNDRGDIINFEQQMTHLQQTSGDFEDAKKYAEKYLDLFVNKIPDAVKNMAELENQIKEAYKQQLEITKQIENQITKMYEKQVEERKKLIDKELKAKVDALKKEKDAYNEARKEADYQKDYEKQREVVNKLQKQLDIAKRDTSLSGQRKVKELLEKLKDEQEKLQDMVQDKIDDDINNMYDKEVERLEKEAEKNKEDLDEKYNKENIQKWVTEALNTGMFTDIDGKVTNLKDSMLEFTDKWGDGLGATGDIIKGELIANLEIARDIINDMPSIKDKLGLTNDYYSNRTSGDYLRGAIDSAKNLNDTLAGLRVQYNAPLVNVEGNVDKNIMPDLQNAIKKATEELAKDIVNRISV